MEKILISCCGSYLKECGVENVFVESDVFGPGVVQSMMSGSNYICGKKGMMILAETLQELQFQQYKQKHRTFPEHFTSPNKSHNWNLHENNMPKLINQYETFTKDSGEKSAQFAFWQFFLNDAVSVLIDLVRPHRKTDWGLYLSATRRAIPLFFFFNRTNYERWVLLYFEDCMTMRSKFPEFWDHFSEENFVVYQTKQKGSGIPMDQAVEKQYNKPANGPSGIIGFTRCKEAVCK